MSSSTAPPILGDQNARRTIGRINREPAGSAELRSAAPLSQPRAGGRA